MRLTARDVTSNTEKKNKAMQFSVWLETKTFTQSSPLNKVLITPTNVCRAPVLRLHKAVDTGLEFDDVTHQLFVLKIKDL